MSVLPLIRRAACLFMLRKTSQRSWGMKWLEGVDAESRYFHKNPGRFKIVVGGFIFNRSGTMP